MARVVRAAANRLPIVLCINRGRRMRNPAASFFSGKLETCVDGRLRSHDVGAMNKTGSEPAAAANAPAIGPAAMARALNTADAFDVFVPTADAPPAPATPSGFFDVRRLRGADRL